jgi:hypothetical protein
MRLPDFILQNLEPILQAWEDFARTTECWGKSPFAYFWAGPAFRLFSKSEPL